MSIFNTVYKSDGTLKYSVDFRGNSQANLESEWWTFNWTFNVNANWVNQASWDYWNITHSFNLSQYKTLTYKGTWYVSTWSTWIWLDWDWLICWLYRTYWLWLYYDGSNHYVGSALTPWDFSWEVTIDLTTWDMSASASNWQNISWTLSSAWLSTLLQWWFLWITFDWTASIIKTIEIILS